MFSKPIVDLICAGSKSNPVLFFCLLSVGVSCVIVHRLVEDFKGKWPYCKHLILNLFQGSIFTPCRGKNDGYLMGFLNVGNQQIQTLDSSRVQKISCRDAPLERGIILFFTKNLDNLKPFSVCFPIPNQNPINIEKNHCKWLSDTTQTPHKNEEKNSSHEGHDLIKDLI